MPDTLPDSQPLRRVKCASDSLSMKNSDTSDAASDPPPSDSPPFVPVALPPAASAAADSATSGRGVRSVPSSSRIRSAAPSRLPPPLRVERREPPGARTPRLLPARAGGEGEGD
eukprot:361453-Chlamydomonas_euryale.AAC.3